MFNIFKKIFSKTGAHSTPTIEKTVHADIKQQAIRSHENPINVYWSFWMNKNDHNFQNRIDRAKWIPPKNIIVEGDSCIIQGSESRPYRTTLFTCSCCDFQNRKDSDYDYPCKHMCRFAMEKHLLSDVPHTQEEIDEDNRAREEEIRQRQEELAPFILSQAQIDDVLSHISEPQLTPYEIYTNTNYFSTDGFVNKEEEYNNKVGDLMDEIREQYQLNKIIPLVDKVQEILSNFKKFCYDYGQYGADEYDLLHDRDFENAKEELEDFLRNDYAENNLEKFEEKKEKAEDRAIEKAKAKDKKAIMSAIGFKAIPQANIVNSLFPNNKSYGKKLCKELVDEGNLSKDKEGRKIILSLKK